MSTQEQDVGPEVYKVIGAPGTGKTTRVVGNPELDIEGLMLDNYDKYGIEHQMFVTYTKAGVEEAQDRLSDMLDVTKKSLKGRVRTIHSVCYNILDVDRDQVVNSYHQKQFCDTYDLNFGWDDDEDDIMGADKQDGNALMDLYGWLKSNRKELSEWDDCPAEPPAVDNVEELLHEWEQFKEERGLIQFSDMIEKVVELGVKQIKSRGLGILFPSDDTSDREIIEEAANDPDLDPSLLRGNGAFIDTKVLYVDEVQDLTPLQWEWYLLQKLVCEKVYIGGDDDQCLPPNAPVEVKNSPLFNPEDRDKRYQKNIKDVQVGDLVRTLNSDGEYSYRKVSNIKKKEVTEKRFRTIETEGGNLTAVTDNHKMLARVPSAEYTPQVDKHYVYLMRDDEGNWRIGETDNLRQRLNVERGARCMIPVASFDSKEKALEKENEWSLNYSIPQLTIQQREGEVLSDPDVRERLYKNVNPQYDLIERELGVFLGKPPVFKKSTTRGRTSSVNIIIKKCADMRGDSPRHTLNIQTKDPDTKETLRQFDELTEGESGGGSTRYRTSSTDYSELGDLAQEVSAATGGDVVTIMSPTEERSRATITPAGNLVEGMLIPVASDGEVEWEEIVDIEGRKETTEVYDLTVPGTHTFTTNGIGVSNTIYGWAGANPDFMLNEEGDFEVLERTYRIPQQVWEVCNDTIQKVDNRQYKEVTPDGDDGEFIPLKRPSTQTIERHLDEDDNFILFRARYMIDEFAKDLQERGIPYKNRSTFDIWTGDMPELGTAFEKIVSTKESLNSSEMDALRDNIPEIYVDDPSKGDRKSQVLSGLGGVSAEDAMKMFSFSEELRKDEMFVDKYVNTSDELNYYEGEALKGFAKNKETDMNPERIKLGTIHSAKGREANTVIVATDTTETIASNMREDTKDNPRKKISDAERRVYYVAMSRASEKLVLAEGMVNPDTVIRLKNLIGKEHLPKEWDEGTQQYRQRQR